MAAQGGGAWGQMPPSWECDFLLLLLLLLVTILPQPQPNLRLPPPPPSSFQNPGAATNLVTMTMWTQPCNPGNIVIDFLSRSRETEGSSRPVEGAFHESTLCSASHNYANSCTKFTHYYNYVCWIVSVLCIMHILGMHELPWCTF